MTDRRSLRSDALDIWKCAVTAVRADRVVGAALEVARGNIEVCGERFALDDDARIFVAGGGKAAAAMAAAVENKVAGTEWFERLDGWVNVPD
ncbi:MAG: DUF4147 domain-containing protein, partial [Woeseiaceae bacterium]